MQVQPQQARITWSDLQMLRTIPVYDGINSTATEWLDMFTSLFSHWTDRTTSLTMMKSRVDCAQMKNAITSVADKHPAQTWNFPNFLNDLKQKFHGPASVQKLKRTVDTLKQGENESVTSYSMRLHAALIKYRVHRPAYLTDATDLMDRFRDGLLQRLKQAIQFASFNNMDEMVDALVKGEVRQEFPQRQHATTTTRRTQTDAVPTGVHPAGQGDN